MSIEIFGMQQLRIYKEHMYLYTLIPLQKRHVRGHRAERKLCLLLLDTHKTLKIGMSVELLKLRVRES